MAEQSDASVDSAIQFIVSTIYRYTRSKSENTEKALLLLVAALSVLNNPSPSAIQLSRRLAQLAVSSIR